MDRRTFGTLTAAAAGTLVARSVRAQEAWPSRPIRIVVAFATGSGNDVIALADHFVTRFSAEMGIETRRISTPALNMLLCYHWPGNVRELENVIERAIILSDDGVIHGYNLPPSLQTPVVSEVATEGSLEARMNAIEYEMIVDSLKLHHGNMTEAATQLGLTRRILGLRMAKYKLDHKNFR